MADSVQALKYLRLAGYLHRDLRAPMLDILSRLSRSLFTTIVAESLGRTEVISSPASLNELYNDISSAYPPELQFLLRVVGLEANEPNDDLSAFDDSPYNSMLKELGKILGVMKEEDDYHAADVLCSS